MSFPSAPTFPGRFKRPISSTFHSAPTFPPVGPSNPGQPQITLFDANGQSGANYITGSTGLFWRYFDTESLPYIVWYNTGTETAPDGARGIEVDITELSSASDISGLTATAIASAYSSIVTAENVDGAGTLTACQLTMVINGPTVDAVDDGTGAAISTTQEGQAPS